MYIDKEKERKWCGVLCTLAEWCGGGGGVCWLKWLTARHLLNLWFVEQ